VLPIRQLQLDPDDAPVRLRNSSSAPTFVAATSRARRPAAIRNPKLALQLHRSRRRKFRATDRAGNPITTLRKGLLPAKPFPVSR
jgi:hypothetical protein